MTSYPCPYCRTTADTGTGCPGCGRAPDPDAAAVVRFDAEIGVLNARLAAARSTVTATEEQLARTWQWRHTAAARVRAKVGSASRVPFSAPAPVGGFAAPAAAPAPAAAEPAVSRSPEASTRLVQNALFLLGGLLLGVAAIVFTAVAWSQFGVGGRALLLAAFTGAALAVPPVVLRRGLTATAETFAAVGLLLVLLDGYAAWYVDLFGVADHSALGYAGAVCAVTAAVAAGYEHVTGLAAPRFAALAVAQPVLPLLVAAAHPGATGWSFTFAAVGALNLAVIHLRRSPLTPLGIAAYVLGGAASVLAGCAALVALVVADSRLTAAGAGAALVTAAVIVLAGAVLARVTVAQSVAGGLLVVALALAGGRFADVLDPHAAPVLIAAVVALLAVAVRAFSPLLPAGVRRGPWVGALVVVGGPALVVLLGAVVAAQATLSAAQPFFAAALGARVDDGDWRLPAALAVLAAGLIVLMPASWRRATVVGAAAGLALVIPAGFALPWPAGPALDLIVAAVALLLAARGDVARGDVARGDVVRGDVVRGDVVRGDVVRGDVVRGDVARGDVARGDAVRGDAVRGDVVRGDAARREAVRGDVVRVWFVAIVVVLTGHAVVVGFGRPVVAAATLAVVALLGFGAAAVAWSGPRRGDVGGGSLTAGLLAVPATAWPLSAALPAPAMTEPRAVLVATALLVAALPVIARRWAGYRPFALAAVLPAAVCAPLWALLAGDSVAVYAGVALVLVALTLPAGGRRWLPWAAVPLGLTLLAATASSQYTLLARPYGWLDRIWAGRPGGTGLSPSGAGQVAAGDVVAGGLLVVAVGFAAFMLRGRRAAGWAVAPVLAVIIPATVAAAGAAWPAVPAVMLVVGLTGLLVVALRPPASVPAIAAVSTVSTLLTLAGIAAALPVQASTLVALGAVLVAGVVAGRAARDLLARVAGWLVAVCAALAFAFTAGRALDLPLSAAAFPVLAAAAVALAVGTWLLGGRPVGGRSADGQSVGGPSADGQPVGGRPVDRQPIGGRLVEAWAVQAAAHAGAVIALLLTVGDARRAAAICTLWGLVIGLRALRKGEAAASRALLVVVAATVELGGWWLLIVAEQVATLEAYTLPAAAVALLAGLLARRTRGGLNSWTSYGPALAAALLPTLAAVLAGDGQPQRRLLLGLAALAVVLVGARARLQAPVVAGGIVLTVVALHEMVLVWDLLPRWIPLAAAGLLLVLLAMTLERRRRDLARFRAALTRMG